MEVTGQQLSRVLKKMAHGIGTDKLLPLIEPVIISGVNAVVAENLVDVDPILIKVVGQALVKAADGMIDNEAVTATADV
jgi:hypothetical protein